MTWTSMTDEQRRVTLHAMVRYGGGFVSRLAEAWQHADAAHSASLGAALPDIVARYGPGSDPYAGAAAREAA